MRTQAHQCLIRELGKVVDLVVFGVEDVVVDSARSSAAAWKSVFDPFLRTWAAAHETCFEPFSVHTDYLRHLHGRPSHVGARDFLASRDIALPYDDLHGLAASQEEFFLAEVRRHGLASFPSAILLIRRCHRLHVFTAAVATQACGSEMLKRAGVEGMFDVVLDGLDAPGTGLPVRPDAHLYLQAAKRLDTSPSRAAVIEASPQGVRAAREGGFGAVILVDANDGITAQDDHRADLTIRGSGRDPSAPRALGLRTQGPLSGGRTSRC